LSPAPGSGGVLPEGDDDVVAEGFELGGISEWHLEWQTGARECCFQLVVAGVGWRIALSAAVPAALELLS
jgi:hypothetical protein